MTDIVLIERGITHHSISLDPPKQIDLSFNPCKIIMFKSTIQRSNLEYNHLYKKEIIQFKRIEQSRKYKIVRSDKCIHKKHEILRDLDRT